MSEHLKKCERERRLEKIRGKASGKRSSSAPRYPVADPPVYGNSDYKASGGVVRRMTPAAYLKIAPPLDLDEESEETVAELLEHMRSGREIDAPILSYGEAGELLVHDGRHRAHAAQRLGIKVLPVIVWGSP